MRRPLFLLVLSLALAMALAPAGAVRAAEAVTLASTDRMDVIQEGDWILWQFREELPNAQEVSRVGERGDDGGCVFESTSVSDGTTRSGYFRLYREVAYNATECIITFAVADIPLNRLREFDGSRGNGQQVSASFTPESSRPEVAPTRLAEPSAVTAASTTSTAWYKTVWEDPVNLDVNSVKVNLSWTWNGSCVTSSSNHTAVWYYFTGTGWYIQSKSGSGARNCTYAATQATGLFYNYAWNDDSLLTWTKHSNTTIKGYANGSIGRADSMTKGGENSSLLHTDFLCSWTSC